MSYLKKNQTAWDKLAENGSLFAKVATDEECRQPLKTLDSRGWLPESVEGLNVLCLASGGGWQSILYAVAGANVTVVDISPSMLKRDRQEADRRDLHVKTVQASMDDLSMLEEKSFDIVHQPVSTCYIQDLSKVYQEIARLLRHNGLYISQHKQPTSLQIHERDPQNRYVIGTEYYHKGSLPTVTDNAYREPGTVEYLHRWDQLVGELCRSGFVLEDLREPYRGNRKAAVGHYQHRGLFIAPYVRLKARRVRTEDRKSSSSIWMP